MGSEVERSEYELPEEVENCYICRFNAKTLEDTIKMFPDYICLNIAKFAGCKKCALFLEGDKIADEIETLKNDRRKAKGTNKFRIREHIFELEKEMDKLHKQIEEIMDETSDIYNMYPH